VRFDGETTTIIFWLVGEATMMPIKHPKAKVWRVAAQISLSYALIASIWIYASDRFLAQLADCPPALTAWQTYKGWLFVGVTTVLLYGLLGSLLARALAPSLPATGLRDAAEREPITPFPLAGRAGTPVHF
jgi:hypothetical protein